METPKSKISVSYNRIWLKRILITLAVIIIMPLSLFTIGWFNRDSVIDMLQDWYTENTSGTLEIGKVNARFLNGFPNVSFTLKDITYTNNDTITDQFSSIQIEEAKMTIGAGNILRGNFIFNKIAIKNAIFSSKVITEKPLAYHEQLKQFNRNENWLELLKWLNQKHAIVSIENLKYTAKDTILNKSFDFQIHKFKGSYKANAIFLNGDATLDVTINHLGFNTKKGSFLKNTHITGNPKFSIDIKTDTIAIDTFPIKISDQTFQLTANFNLLKSNGYMFSLENERTDFNAVKALLHDTLFSTLKDIKIKSPVKSTIKLTGKFAYDNTPNIEAQFSALNNEIIVSDKYHFKNATFNGSLTNDIYKNDSVNKGKKSSKDIKIFFDNLTANLEDIELNAVNSYYQSTPEAPNFINVNLHLQGENETMANLIEMDNFDFKGGIFELKTLISGDITNPYQFLNKSIGTFNLQNTRVILKKNGLQLPIEAIDLTLDREHTYLNRLIVNLPNGENLILKGELKNISGLLSKTPSVPTTSRISLKSNNLNVNDILAMAKEFAPQMQSNDRKDLSETLEAIYTQFHPQFDLNIGALTYNNVVINALRSNIELINPETVLLRKFNFAYGDAITDLKGTIKIYPPKTKLQDAIYMNVEATSEGSLEVFTKLFNIELFRIKSGRFKFNGKVNGNVKVFNELLHNATGNLELTQVHLYYPPAEMDIAIDSLALYVKQSDIILDQFNLEIDEFHPVKLNGKIKSFPNFLLDELQEPGSIYLKVTAPFFDADHLLSTLNSFKKDENLANPKQKRALHYIFKDVNKFHPEIELAIDSVKFRDLITEKIDAQIYFASDSILKLNYLDLNYKETSANIHGEVNAHASQADLLNDNPFDLDFSVQVKGKSEDLNDYLNTTNFEFKSGDFEFFGNYEGQSKNLKLLNSKAFGNLKISGTTVNFEAADIQIPIDSLHLEINNDLATLKTLDIQLPGKSSVLFSGSIDHFSEFINGEKENPKHSSNFSIHAPYLDTSDIVEFLDRPESTTKKAATKGLILEKWKSALAKINTSFYPSVTVKVDTLNHDSFDIRDFESHLLFDNEKHFEIEDTKLDFYGGSIDMNVEIGIQDDKNTPVDIEMNATDVDLHELVTRFDYFKNADLKAAEKIEGSLNYNLIVKGTLANDGSLNMTSLNGFLKLELNNLELYDYKPIMENVPLMKNERFEKLRFRPIVQTFEIKNGEIIIPRTEIQSSAIHFFMEGHLKLNEYLNIWLSVPWKNLKSNDGLLLPEKTTYKDAGSKFYIQFVQDKNSEKERKQRLKVKFKLGNRKLKKLRDSLN